MSPVAQSPSPARRALRTSASALLSCALATALVPLSAVGSISEAATLSPQATSVSGATITGEGTWSFEEEKSYTATIEPSETAMYVFDNYDYYSLSIYTTDSSDNATDVDVDTRGCYGCSKDDDDGTYYWYALLAKNQTYSLHVYGWADSTFSIKTYALSADGATSISAGEKIEGETTTYGEVDLYSFTPDTSTLYRFWAVAKDEDSYCGEEAILFDSNWNQIGVDYDSGSEEPNFSIVADLDADSTYYLAVLTYLGSLCKEYAFSSKDVTDITGATATIGAETFEFTGDGVVPDPTVTTEDGETLVEGTDYYYRDTNGLYPGSGTLTVYGYGYGFGDNWDTTITLNYTITVPDDISTITTSSSKSISLDSSTTYALFAFTPPATGTFAFTSKITSSSSTSLYLRVINPATQRWDSDDFSTKTSISMNLTKGVTCYAKVYFGSDITDATASCTLSVARTWKTNPFYLTGKTVKVKGKFAKGKKTTKKTVSIAASKALAVKHSKGTVTFSKVAGTSKVVVNKKTGKLTVKAGIKRGTYKIRVRGKDTGSAYYASGTDTVTVTVKVV